MGTLRGETGERGVLLGRSGVSERASWEVDWAGERERRRRRLGPRWAVREEEEEAG